MTGPRNIARVRSAAVFLEQLLQLPPGHTISSAVWDQQAQECIFAITGPRMPEVPYGHYVPELHPKVQIDLESDHGFVITWPGGNDSPTAARGAARSPVRDLAAERLRQVNQEDWTPEHDDSHVNDEIAALAAWYAMPPAARDWPASETGFGATWGEAILPDGWCGKSGDRRRELVKAGALIIAEIERLDRLEASAPAWATGPAWSRDEERTLCLLLLCGGHGVTAEVIAGWSDEECQQAEDWAGREHLAASDNDDVERVPMPAHVAAHPPKPSQGGLWG